MDEIQNDLRFSHILKNPKYFKMKRQETKIKIDKRFKGMFTDDNFKLKYSVDCRGKPVKISSDKNLKRFYEISESESAFEEDSNDENEDKNSLNKSKRKKKNKIISNNLKGLSANREKSSSDDDQQSDDKDNLEISDKDSVSDTASSSSEDDEEDDSEKISHLWGELDRDAPTTDIATSRLAICNMDWDRIKSVDLFVLFNSFKPDTGYVKSIAIYPSEFGIERMNYEEQHGPQELTDKKLDETEFNEENVDEKYNQEKLRTYQLNRLKYFYAVMECDSIETANHIYNNCNNLEYESSATVLDLRFIPDDMVFDLEPTSIATSMPVTGSYKPTIFVNSALHESNVTLTWDETPVERTAITMRDFSKTDLEDMDVKEYLASSSDESRDDRQEIENIELNSIEKIEKQNVNSHIEKYRNLLKEITEQEDIKHDTDIDMEVTWNPGLKDSAKDLVKKKKIEALAPWDQYLEKKKQKRKQKKENKKLKTFGDSDYEDNFLEEKKIRKREKKVKKETITEEEKIDLELLVQDNFIKKSDQNDILKISKRQRNKIKKFNKENKIEEKITDPRFQEIYNNPKFNLDPSANEYAKKKKLLK